MTEQKQTFGEHLDALRATLLHIGAVVAVLAVVLFCFKDEMFRLVLAPCRSDFVTFSALRSIVEAVWACIPGVSAPDVSSFFAGDIELIATDISSQLMTHLSVSAYLGLLLASPFVLYEIMKFVSPALYANERKYAGRIVVAVYALFMLGLVASYLLLFPISCRFLAAYQVSADVTTMVTLDSYISLFFTLTLLMGLVFELPVVCYMLGRMGLVDRQVMVKYRKHALVLIMVAAAVITPPDVMTLALVTVPLYLLYEVSIRVVKPSLSASAIAP